MILIFLCYSCLLVISGTQDVTCGADCSCHGYTMACSGGNVPTYLPWNITEIFLQDVDFNEVAKHFQSQQQEWSAITRLTLQATFSKDIVSGMFTVFKVLKYLKVEGDELSNITDSAFVGLDTVETLDLSANGNLLHDSVAKALCFVNNGTHVLSNLKMLNISWIGRKYFTPVNMDFNFFVSLSSGRRLKHLDISHINLDVLDIRYFYPLCDNGLETLVLEFAVFSSVGYYYIPGKLCPRLKSVSFEGSLFASGALNYISLLSRLHCRHLVFYNTVAVLNLKSVSDTEMTISHPDRQFVLDFSECPMQFQRIIYANNKLKFVNTTVFLHPTTASTLQYLDFSDNLMEYISPESLAPSVSLRLLDISKNKLQNMNQMYPEDFKRLLLPLTKLKELKMSSNRLEDLPTTFLSSNSHLVHIDLSNNMLKEITFDINHLEMLQVIDLSGNNFHIIDANTLQLFQRLSTVFVDLRDNQLECGCESTEQELIEWMKDNARKGEVASLYCDYEGKRLDVALESSVNDIQRDCMMKVVHTVLVVTIPSCIAILSLLVITLIMFRRRRLKQRALLDVIEKIRKGEFINDFLTFLCFASDDTEVIERDVYPHLNSNFKDIIGVDKEFVCKGDFNFRPGFRILDETEKCVEKCAVLVAAISRTFCQRHWCEKELLQAVNTGKPIVLIMLEKVDKKLMPPVINQFFRTLVHASLINDGKETKLVPDWRVLCNAILELAGIESVKSSARQDNSKEIPVNINFSDLTDDHIEMH